MAFIFHCHFNQQKNMKKAQNVLNLEEFLFNPKIRYNIQKKILNFMLIKMRKIISFKKGTILIFYFFVKCC